MLNWPFYIWKEIIWQIELGILAELETNTNVFEHGSNAISIRKEYQACLHGVLKNALIKETHEFSDKPCSELFGDHWLAGDISQDKDHSVHSYHIILTREERNVQTWLFTFTDKRLCCHQQISFHSGLEWTICTRPGVVHWNIVSNLNSVFFFLPVLFLVWWLKFTLIKCHACNFKNKSNGMSLSTDSLTIYYCNNIVIYI